MNDYCKLCGGLIEEGMSFCPKCGAKLLISDNNTYFSKNSPVSIKNQMMIISAEKKPVVNFSFQNMWDETIEAVYINVDCLEITGEFIRSIKHTYLDLNCEKGEFFGDDVLLYLRDLNSRKFKLHIEKVVFDDDKILDLTNLEDFSVVNPPVILEEFQEQLIRELTEIGIADLDAYTYKFSQNDGYWYCCCSYLNINDNNKCFNCGLNKEQAIKISNIEYLKQREIEFEIQSNYEMALGLMNDKSNQYSLEKAIAMLKKYPDYKNSNSLISECEQLLIIAIEENAKRQEAERLEQIEKAERLKKERAEQAERDRIEKEKLANLKAKIKKIAIIVSPIVAVCVVFLIILNTVIIPSNKYSQAMTYYNNSEYDKAFSVFEELGSYKDSKDKVLESKYSQAMDLYNNGEYEKAVTIFTELGEYKDSKDKVLESKYSQAMDLYNNGKLEDSVLIFAELNDYKDSKSISTGILNKCSKLISAVSFHSAGLKKDGTVVASGDNDDGQCDVSDWKDIIAVSAGIFHTIGLKKDGTVVATGNNDYGQCDVSEWNDIVAISARGAHTIGLKKDGTVVATGNNYYGQCDVSGWSDIVAISSGYGHTIGLKKDGTVVASGDNDDGQCDVSEWEDITAISAGYYHTLGLKKDGTVVATGYNYNGRCDVSEWKDIIAISADYYHTVGLKKDGTVVGTGKSDNGQRDVSEWKDIIAISAGYYHTVGLKKDGTIVATGSIVATGKNDNGQCDVSGWKDIGIPR